MPQEQNATLRGVRKLVYAVDDSGHYEGTTSTGSKVEETVTTQAIEEFIRLRDEVRARVVAGTASPLEYHMYDRRMDLQTLAQITGIWTWRVRRHLQPRHFATLKRSLLERYADVLGLTVEQLTTLPQETDTP